VIIDIYLYDFSESGNETKKCIHNTNFRIGYIVLAKLDIS